MSTTIEAPAVAYEREQVIRHLALMARDLYEQHGDTGPHQIVGADTLVMWHPAKDAAVFHLNGRVLTVPSSALDAVGLVPSTEPAQEQSSVTTGESA